ANIVSEVGETHRTDEGVLRAFVTGNPIEIDRKGMQAIRGRPTARITAATNTLPRWSDRTNGVWRRQSVVPFNVVIPLDQQDKTLARRIIANELAGLFLWALAGLARLRAQGRFTESAVCTEAAQEHRLESNPAKAFLTEECRFAVGSEIASLDL